MIVYLHGFSSAPASHKARLLKASFSPIEFMIADYPSHRPQQAIATVAEILTEVNTDSPDEEITLIGSSLGGYYAQYLATQNEQIKKVVLINPALDPQPPLQPWIGHNTNMITGESFFFSQQDWQQLKTFDVTTDNILTPTLLLVDECDAVIDPGFAVQKYRSLPGKTIVYPGGSHSFDHLDKAIPEIRRFLLS